MKPADMPAIMVSLAALEEWLAGEGDERRLLAIEFSGGWRASLAFGSVVTEHQGATLADAIAQAAQVVISDPNLGAVP